MRRRKASVPLRAQDVPALRAFCRAYLHEDAIALYGSAAGAVEAFRADAPGDDVEALAREWATFVQMTKGQPLAAVRSLLTDTLGARWHPATTREIDAVTDALNARR
jgi:hypothetical protein